MSAELAARANVLARESRHAYVALTADSTALDVATWLQTCDPNGCHLVLAPGDACDDDGYATLPRVTEYDTDTAWEALALMLEGCE